MDRNTQAAISAQYDALMFATTRDAARKAARELVQLVLGDEAAKLRLLKLESAPQAA